MKSQLNHLSGLNGLRAIAAIAVVISHITYALPEFGLNQSIFGLDVEGKAVSPLLAKYGVTLFFTLSGFLITYLFLKEKQEQKPRIKAFYIRRILRIWPLYYAYFALAMVITFLTGSDFQSASVPFYIFLAANIPMIIDQNIPLLAHYWSLGVEEQFYLFFPQIAKSGNRKVFKTFTLILASLLILKAICWLLFKAGYPMPIYAIGICRFDAMIIGVLAGFLYFQRHDLFLKIATHKISQVISWTILLAIMVNRFHIFSVIDDTIVSLMSVCLITGQITKRNRIVNLENSVCNFIGKISYGIYVIHPLIIFLAAELIGELSTQSAAAYLLIFISITIASIGVAYISYELLEKPFLKLKEKYSGERSEETISMQPAI